MSNRHEEKFISFVDDIKSAIRGMKNTMVLSFNKVELTLSVLINSKKWVIEVSRTNDDNIKLLAHNDIGDVEIETTLPHGLGVDKLIRSIWDSYDE